MVAYDPDVIQRFADRLYNRARMIVITLTLVGGVAGGVAGFWMGLLLDANSARPPRHLSLDELGTELIACLIGAILFGLIGLLAGRERAFLLRLQAQVALCQAKIEENTRKSE